MDRILTKYKHPKMKRISLELVLPKTKIVNERQAIIAEFVERINKERIGTRWKPVTGKGIAMKLSHLKKDDLLYFLSECKSARCGFGSAFFGSLKIHK